MLLVVAAGVYFGLPVGEAYFRYYRFEDKMKQQVRFARLNADQSIATELRSYADSIGLPPEAHNVMVSRSGGRIVVSTAYTEAFHLPGYVKLQTFKPRAEGTY